jgi:hypothetical protein
MDDQSKKPHQDEVPVCKRLKPVTPRAEDGSWRVRKVYRFRAECERDVNELRRRLGMKLYRVTVTTEVPFPDAEVEIETSLALEEIRDAMRRVVDGHVMVQTLARRSQYTGERDYDL